MKKVLVALVVVFIFGLRELMAEPFTPDSGEFVVTRTNDKAHEKYLGNIKILKEQKAENPQDIQIALTLAQSYISAGRQSADPRYYGLAENALKPWWNEKTNPQLLLLKAIILQFDHQFNESNHVLTNLLKNNPRNTQALLLLVNNKMSIGDYLSARSDCAALSLLTSPSLSAACFVAIKGLQVSTDEAVLLVNNLNKLMANEKGLADDARQWMSGIMLEIALLHNQLDLAEAIIKQLESDGDMIESLALLHADVLMRRGMYSEVLQVLSGENIGIETGVKRLLAKRLGKFPDFEEEKRSLEERLEKEVIRGGLILRERALLELTINQDLTKALGYAKSNWQNQKTITDAALLLRCALLLDDKEIVATLNSWIEKNGIKVNLDQLFMS